MIYPSGRWPSGNITNKFLTAGVYLTYTPLGHGLYITYIYIYILDLTVDGQIGVASQKKGVAAIFLSSVHNNKHMTQYRNMGIYNVTKTSRVALTHMLPSQWVLLSHS